MKPCDVLPEILTEGLS